MANRVFATPTGDIEVLKINLTKTVSSVTEKMLNNTLREVECCLDIIRGISMAHTVIY